MKRLLGLLAMLGAGAGLAYMLDPDRGRHRRARMRDRAVALTNRMSDTLEGQSRHWSNRARGVVAEARHRFARRDAPPGGTAL
jgi:hypothetical protein